MKTINEDIFKKLDKIIKLLAIIGTTNGTLKQQIRILTEVGFSPTQIADITERNVNLINVVKHNIKKEVKNG